MLSDSRLKVQALGIDFPNFLGLAAGFDKNAVAVNHWHKTGFGYVEVGTVTWWPQPGNDPPRLFRVPGYKAIVNRFGFNNRGASVMAGQLRRSKREIPLGINLGKNKIVEASAAAENYASSYDVLADFADYIVINVSSPNTPGLRDLQQVQALGEIVHAIRKKLVRRPLLIKLSPDLNDAALLEITDYALSSDVDGLIATNTTTTRPDGFPLAETGGLSGAPLRDQADATLELIANRAQGRLTLIGVGGIMSADDLQRKLDRGAILCQAYTGFVYGGPIWPSKVLMDWLIAHPEGRSRA